MRAASAFAVLAAVAVLFGGLSTSAQAGEFVRGYIRSDGTYVAPYVRSAPDGIPYNNYGHSPGRSYQNSPPSYGNDVGVRGYYKKNGTYVRPHRRAKPRRRW